MLKYVTVGICVHMLEWATEATKHLAESDLLELYCGNGNFTVALAENFRLVPLIWWCCSHDCQCRAQLSAEIAYYLR